MFAKFDKIPSMIRQDIKETKPYGRTVGRTDNMKTVYPPTKFAGGIINAQADMGHCCLHLYGSLQFVSVAEQAVLSLSCHRFFCDKLK